MLVGAHVPDGKSWFHFASDPRFLEADDPLLGFAHAEEEDACFVFRVDLELVAGDERDAAPCNELRAEEADRGRRYPATRCLTAKRTNGLGVSEEKGGFFPDQREQCVQVIRCGRSLPRGDALRRTHLAQEPELRVVDQFPLLPFANGFDGQSHLFPKLIYLVAVQIRDPSVSAEDGLNRAEVVFTRRFFVINEACRQKGFACVDRQQIQSRADMARDDAVDAVDPAVYVNLGQKFQEPARSDFTPLRHGDGGGSQIAGGLRIQAELWIFGDCVGHCRGGFLGKEGPVLRTLR